MQWISRKYQHFYSILTASKVRVFGAIMIALGALVAWRSMLEVGIAIAAVQAIGMLVLPVLRTEYALFSLLTYPIGKVVGFVAMGIVYFLVITPTGLLKKRTFNDGWEASTPEINAGKMHE